MARVAFMGTPAFAVPILGVLLGEHQVVAVYTRPDQPAGRGQGLTPSPVKRLALERGLPVFQPATLKGEEAALRGLAPEVIVVAAYGLLLPPAVLAVTPRGCVNVHPSLLPRHRGPSPVAGAILAGGGTTGVSLMLMDQGYDTGPLLAQEALPILPHDTTLSLTERLAQAGARMLQQLLPQFLLGEVVPRPQEGPATYTRLIKKEEGEMGWRLSARELGLRVRAFSPWPGTYTRFRGKRLEVLESYPVEAPGPWTPGRVRLLAAGAGVETGDGVLELQVVQLEGKKALPISDFLRGQRDFSGSVLPY